MHTIAVERNQWFEILPTNGTSGLINLAIKEKRKLELELIQAEMTQKPVLRADVCAPTELELELVQTQMAQKPMLRAEVYAHAMRASQNRKKEVRREKEV